MTAKPKGRMTSQVEEMSRAIRRATLAAESNYEIELAALQGMFGNAHVHADLGCVNLVVDLSDGMSLVFFNDGECSVSLGDENPTGWQGALMNQEFETIRVTEPFGTLAKAAIATGVQQG